jgi:hypothetical protein
MSSIDSQLQRLDEIYKGLEAQLQKPALATAEYVQCISGQPIEDASRIVARLLQTIRRQDLPSDGTSQISALCARLGVILKLAENRAEELRRQQSAAREELRDLHTGGRFLQNIQGYRENHPKYIDARH